MTSFPVSSSSPLSTAVVPRAVPSIERRTRLVGTEVGPMPWIVAYDGQDPLEYAKAVAGMGPEGNTASHHPGQWLNRHNQTFLDTHGTHVTSNPNPLTFGVRLPPSLERAKYYAEPDNRRHHCPGLVNFNPFSAEVTQVERAQTLVALRELAKWNRLRNAHLPNSEPIVGGLEVDPGGFADEFGVKGLSVYSAFIDTEGGLRCRVCGEVSHTIDSAMLHQRHMRHYQL